MGKSPETFPRVYVAMTQAGETGGFLDVVLGQIAEFQAREKELRSRVFSALLYPSVLMVLAIGVLIFLLVFFIPRFQKIFEGFGAALPALTRFIVSVSEWMAHYGPLLGLALIAAAMVARKWLKTEPGRRAWERVELKIPLIGPLVARYAMARFCRMLGTLVGAGVPLISALSVARGSIGNQTLVDALAESIERVKRGDSLAASLSDCGALFPGSVLEMSAVAEDTGQLNHELVRLASVAEAALARNLRTAVALAEPLMLFLMAGFIGVIFVGMVIPIFSIQEYIK
jgi:type II secretory pathway component PulF